MKVREFSFSGTNANFVWPHNEATLNAFLDFKFNGTNGLNQSARILELGSGTGVLSIALRKLGFSSAITSDYDSTDIAENIEYNCLLNNVYHVHIPHTWGEQFPWEQLENIWQKCSSSVCTTQPPVVLVASDILLYKKLYSNLVHTICQLLSYNLKNNADSCCSANSRMKPFMILGAKRRVTGDDEFFTLLRKADCEVTHLGGRIYCIKML